MHQFNKTNDSVNVDKKKYTLVLNQNFYPNSVCGVKETMGHFVNGGQALDPSTFERFNFEEWLEKHTIKDPTITIRSEKLWILVPDILLLAPGRGMEYQRKPRFSRKKLFMRDRYKCGYCGCLLTNENRTIDHVIPISHGGKTTYKNTVACCFPCNSTKGNKTYEHMQEHFGWALRHQLTDVNADLLYHVPIKKRLKCWDAFLLTA